MLKWAYNKNHVKIKLPNAQEINRNFLCLPDQGYHSNATKRKKKVQRSMTTTFDQPQSMTLHTGNTERLLNINERRII